MPVEGYFANPRVDLIPFLPAKSFECVLDLGCGEGNFAYWLKSKGIAKQIVGIEIDRRAAAEAQKKLDRVFCQSLDREPLPEELREIDFALCLDVLEHLQDPWTLLRALRLRMKPEGQVFISIPNVRNFRVVLPLLFKGKWDYQDTGILDRTHLRFFTKDSALKLLQETGFEIVECNHTGMRRGSLSFWLNLFSFSFFRGFFELQYVLLANANSRQNSQANQ